MAARNRHETETSLSLASTATREQFKAQKDHIKHMLVKHGIQDTEQVLHDILETAIRHTNFKVHIMFSGRKTAFGPRTVSAEVYTRALINIIWSIYSGRYDQGKPCPFKTDPLDKSQWYHAPLSPEHGDYVAKATAKTSVKREAAKSTKYQENAPVPLSRQGSKRKAPSVKEEETPMSPPTGTGLEAPQPMHGFQSAQATSPDAPYAVSPSSPRGLEHLPSGELCSIACVDMDEDATFQVWRDHLQSWADIYGNELPWHVSIPADKSHLFFGRQGNQTSQVIESCTRPAHIAAGFVEADGNHRLFIAIYAKTPLVKAEKRNGAQGSRLTVDGLALAMVQMFQTILTWSIKVNEGAELEFMQFMRERNERLVRESVASIHWAAAEAAHASSIIRTRRAQAAQQDTLEPKAKAEQ